jgi:hypothetical protein
VQCDWRLRLETPVSAHDSLIGLLQHLRAVPPECRRVPALRRQGEVECYRLPAETRSCRSLSTLFRLGRRRAPAVDHREDPRVSDLARVLWKVFVRKVRLGGFSEELRVDGDIRLEIVEAIQARMTDLNGEGLIREIILCDFNHHGRLHERFLSEAPELEDLKREGEISGLRRSRSKRDHIDESGPPLWRMWQTAIVSARDGRGVV